jgi:hypothetical protein
MADAFVVAVDETAIRLHKAIPIGRPEICHPGACGDSTASHAKQTNAQEGGQRGAAVKFFWLRNIASASFSIGVKLCRTGNPS